MAPTETYLPKNRNTWSLLKLVTSTAAAIAVLYCIVGYQGQVIRPRNKTTNQQIARRDFLRLDPDSLVDPPDDWLMDVEPFRYIMNSKSCLDADLQNNDRLSFAVLVHSKPDHFRQRQSIRKTWGSVVNVRTVFLLGVTDSVRRHSGTKSRPDTASLIQAEQTKYGDLVQGNFVDSYRNLTYKHVMGLKWVHQNCPGVDYIIKADDDSFINIFQLEQFLGRTFPEPPTDSLLCNVVPEGSTVLRSGKYAVSESEFQWGTYPRFCSGLAYVMSPPLATKLLRASQFVPFLWIDDVFITGLVAEAISTKYFYLNLRYTYDYIDLKRDWNQFIFGELNTTLPDWRTSADILWNNIYTTAHL